MKLSEKFSKLRLGLSSDKPEIQEYVKKCSDFGLDPDWVGRKFRNAKTGKTMFLRGLRKFMGIYRVVVSEEYDSDNTIVYSIKEFMDRCTVVQEELK